MTTLEWAKKQKEEASKNLSRYTKNDKQKKDLETKNARWNEIISALSIKDRIDNYTF